MRKTLRCIAPRLPRHRRGARLDVFYGDPRRHAIPEVNRRYRFCFRPNLVQVNMRVARHVGPIKKSRRLPGSFLGEAALFVVVNVLLPVADDGSRLGHVMIDPRCGLNGFTAWSVIDHHEREEP